MKTLLYKSNGSIELLDANRELLWSSDSDDDFADEFDDVLDPDNEEELDDITGYLIDTDWLDEDEEINVSVEGDGEDENDDDDDDDGDNVIEGKFERVR